MRFADCCVRSSQGGHCRRDGTQDSACFAVILSGKVRNAAMGRFEAKDRTEGRWDADATTAIAAEGEWYEAIGDGIGRPGGGPARVVIGVVRVARGAVGCVVAACVLWNQVLVRGM